MDDLAPRRTQPLSCPSPVASEDCMSSLIIGVIFIVGGLSGQLALVGTNSGTALAVVGALLIARGIYRIRKQRAQPQAPEAARRTRGLCRGAAYCAPTCLRRPG